MERQFYVIGPDFGELTNFAGTKYPKDIMKICENAGCIVVKINEEYTLKRCYKFLKDSFKLLCTKKRGVVFYIDRVTPSISRHLVYKIAKIKKQRLVPIIEDIDVWRHLIDKGDKEVELLNQADVVISQNLVMTQSLKNKGISSEILSLEVLDFLSDELDSVDNTSENNIICYGGNLTMKQSGFIYQLRPSRRFKYRIYGGNLEKIIDNLNIEYCGCFSDDNCIGNIKGDWGLVWNGKSLYIDPNDKRSIYYNFVTPHKFSMYALCGIPVIVYEKSAMADFVKKNHCGITIKDLNEIEEKILGISKEQYFEMKNNIKKIGLNASKGMYLGHILEEIEMKFKKEL